MKRENLSVCLLNDSFPPQIDGVANAVLNYARIIQSGPGSAVVGVPDYPGTVDSYPFPVVRYPSFDTTRLVGYRAGYPFSPRAMDALAAFHPDIIHSHCPVMSTVMARALRERLDIPVVFTYHTKFDIDIRRALYGHLLQQTAIRLLVDNVPELPRGVVNAITGPGGEIGKVFSEHPGVDMITFTGGLDTGKDIMRRAAGTMKRVSLELGGKSANVVFADCDMDKAVSGCAAAIFSNAGQTCTAGSRLVLEESIAGEFIPRLKAVAEGLKMGYCLDPETKMGPVDNESQLNKILGYIEQGKQCAQLITGGYRYMENGCDKGFFIAPTIFLNPPVDSPIVQEEIFGPVLVIQTFRTEDEAVELANCTKYGLCSGLWTTDLNRAMAVSRRLRSGNVWVNHYTGFAPECETGGYKESGVDRAAGVEGFLKYTEIKHVNMDFTR